MKKWSFIFTFTVTVVLAFGQTIGYHPFPDSNAFWGQTFWYINPSNYCTDYDDQSLYISGDTTIGAYTYHKLYLNGYWSEFCVPPNIPFPPYYYVGQYWGAFRQDVANKKVYLNNYGNDTLAYDFNLNVGDTLRPSFINWFNYVLSIDSVLVGSQYNKRFWLSDGWHPNYAALMEGIGNTQGAFNHLMYPFEAGSNLWCLNVNDQTVWSDNSSSPCTLITRTDDFKIQNHIVISPNPFSVFTILKINQNLKDATMTIYNTIGKVMKEIKNISGQEIRIQRDNLPVGVYFIRLAEENQFITQDKVIITN